MKITREPLRAIKNMDALRVMLSFGQTRCDGDILEDWKLSSPPGLSSSDSRFPDFVVVVSFSLSLSLTSVSPRRLSSAFSS